MADSPQLSGYPAFSGVSASGLGTILVAGGWTRDAGPPGVVRLTTSTDQVGIGTTSPLAGSRLEVAQDDASNTTFTDVEVVTHTTSGAPTAGIGAALLLRAEGSSGTQNAARLVGVLTNVGAGTEAGALDIYTRTAGAALSAAWRFGGDGSLIPQTLGNDLGSTALRPDIFVRGWNTSSRRVTAAGADNVTATDGVAIYNATLGNQTPTLPDLTANPGMHVYVAREAADVSGNTVVVTPQGGQTIGGSATRSLAANQTLHLFAPAAGSDWLIL
jgi:hypothetical protein